MSAIRPRAPDFDTDEELQEHLALLETDTPSDEDISVPEDFRRDRRTFEDVRADIETVRDEMNHLRARLAILTRQAEIAIRSRAEWADASAHAQLGEYPWAKLVGAMAGSFALTRLARRLPFGRFATAAAPLILAALSKRAAR
ncbi:hypothetical protein SAMN05216228_104113 [Rhizobium tibeticum]|uniref:Uncharacterized protein n=1 Tax=Rhizobium tibeticum TaxID=501024 RepID=A0A1H8VC55_9HYPH|nr:hypothetical protein [Rhizobium tibeticum]SEI18761.1 hypothetical protein RTCCBAU85039_5997 [Rhizobium tibeticum]SEP12833.1 hypothetical protein SAMN05216228_104113 [Rhizobium tibeticum]